MFIRLDNFLFSIFLLSSVGRRPRKTVENRFPTGDNQNKEKGSRGYRGEHFDYVLGRLHDCLSKQSEIDEITSYSLYSSLAQLVERMTVNHDVAGSSPAREAKESLENIVFSRFFLLFCPCFAFFIDA